MNKKFKKFVKIIAAFTMCLALLLPAAGCDLLLDIFHTHDYSDWEIIYDSDCIEDGLKERTCLDCGFVETEIIPAIGHHTYGEWETAKESDCVEAGLKERTCSVCGDVDEQEIPAMSTSGEHSYGEWSTTKEKSCGTDGSKERTCSVCGDVEKEVIPATGEHDFNGEGVCTVCGKAEGEPDEDDGDITGDEEGAKSSDLSIHFLELGNKYTGDCTLIKCGDTEILIDAGSRKDSAATIKKYVDQYCTDGVLEYVIATHAHQDHIAGFVGNSSGNSKTGILYQYKIGTLIQFAGTKATTQIYQDYLTAVEYVKSQGTTVYTANQCWYQTDGAKKQYYLDEAQTISMNILYNYYYDHSTNEENDYSVCMLLTQQTPDKTYNFLFTGDLEEKGESYLVDNNDLPEVELFKGGHHGSYTASTEKLLKVIKPKNVAVCCCCGTTEYTSNVQNTFPAQAFIDRVSKYTQNIYCTTLIVDYSGGKFTSMNGNIVFYTKGGKLKLWCSNNNTILKDTDWFKANRVWNGI